MIGGDVFEFTAFSDPEIEICLLEKENRQRLNYSVFQIGGFLKDTM